MGVAVEVILEVFISGFFSYNLFLFSLKYHPKA